MRFRRQLFVGLGALVALIAVMATTGIVALHSTAVTEGELARQYAEDLARVQRLRYLGERLVATSRGYLLTGEASLRAQFKDAKAELDRALGELAPLSSNEAAQVDRTARNYLAAASAAVEQRSLMRDASQIVPYFDKTLEPRRARLETDLEALTDQQRGAFEHSLRSAGDLARRAQIALVMSSVLAIGCGLALAFLVSRRLTTQYRQVEAATARATRAAAAREEVLAVVSHDLRNPLGAITMGATLLQGTTAEPDTRRYVHTIHNAATRMQHMVDELLEASQIDRGTIELHPEKLDARDLLDTTIELFRARASERGIELRGDAATATVHADRERALEVLSNLIGNALKFTPQNGHVAVRAEPAGETVRFTVADDGPGIAAEQLPHLFERYWQGRRRGSRDGLGLGLYICKRLIEAHRGAIGVDSVVGRGTTFWFTLPAQPA